jgi:hypothetical protein
MTAPPGGATAGDREPGRPSVRTPCLCTTCPCLHEMGAPANSGRLSQSPKPSRAVPRSHAGAATIALVESDRPDGREPTMPMPRTQLSRPRAVDECIARMMRKPNRARSMSDAHYCFPGPSGCWFRVEAPAPVCWLGRGLQAPPDSSPGSSRPPTRGARSCARFHAKQPRFRLGQRRRSLLFPTISAAPQPRAGRPFW